MIPNPGATAEGRHKRTNAVSQYQPETGLPRHRFWSLLIAFTLTFSGVFMVLPEMSIVRDGNSSTNFRQKPLVASEKNFPYLFKTLPRELESFLVEGLEADRIPKSISGSWMKTGFCVFESASGTYRPKMLFDTAGCGYSFNFANGKFRMSAKMLRSKYLKAFQTDQHPQWRTFDEFNPPRRGWSRVSTLLSQDQADNYLVNLVSVGGNRTAALTDLAGEMQMDLHSMNTSGILVWNDDLESDKWNMLSSAHPSRSAHRPDVFVNFLLNMNIPKNLAQTGSPFVYNIFELDPKTFKRRHIGNIPTQRLHYVHENAITERFYVIIEFPFVWDLTKIVLTTAIKEALTLDRSLGINFKVVNLKDGRLAQEFRLPAESFYAFHQVNAWEEDNKIVMTMIAYDNIAYHLKNSFSLEGGHLNNTFNLPPATLKRVTLDLEIGKSCVISIGDVDMELPVISDLFRGRKNKVAYAHAKSVSNKRSDCNINGSCGGTWWDSIVKVDMETGIVLASWKEDDHWPSEPVFVPMGSDEDDGILLNIVLGSGPTSFLLVLDAKNLSQIAKVPLPMHLPYQSHGNWISQY